VTNDLQIRRALPEEATTLSHIAFTAKAHWGYPERWMRIWAPQLTFSPDYFRENEGWVAEVERMPIAFCTLQDRNGIAWIENLWVVPEYIGKGVGKVLFLHCVELSQARGYKALQLEADPHAMGFYERMGMYKMGERHSEVDGLPRILPIMEMKL